MWIRFELDEPAAPTAALPFLGGGRLDLADRRSQVNRVLFFAHGWECTACQLVIQRLSAANESFCELGADLLVVLPNGADVEISSEALDQRAGVLLLFDPANRLRRRYAALFEFELPGDLMLFLLDRNGSPFRAWVGEEAEPLTLIDESLRQLKALELRCPE